MTGPRPTTVEAAGVRWWVAPGLAVGSAPALLAAALAAAEAAPDLKSGRRKSLRALDLEGRGRPTHLLKESRYRGLDAALRRLRGSKARRELTLALALDARGLPAPVPLAAGERREGARLSACYLLLRLLPDAEDLAARWPRAGAAERRALAVELGKLARRLHDAGLLQRDFAPNNVLVCPGPELLAIDFERARLLARAARPAERAAMLAKLERRASAALSRSDRMRFLHAYAGDEARALWARVERAARVLARRDLRHWQRTATRPGRRFAPVAQAGWHGFARRDADLPRLLAAAERRTPPDPTLWCVEWKDLGPEQARRAWATALALHDGRGLAPRPLALLRRGSATVLCSQRVPGSRLAGEAEHPAEARVLERRLLALGRLAPWPAGSVALEPGRAGMRAVLLDPRLLQLG